jgi:DNA topoisomerase-6 subunit A
VVGPLLFGDETIAWIAPSWVKAGYSVPSIVEPKYAEICRYTVDFVRLLEKARSGTASRGSVLGTMTA